MENGDGARLHRVLTENSGRTPDDTESIARETYAFPLEQGEESHRAPQLQCGIIDGVRISVPDTLEDTTADTLWCQDSVADTFRTDTPRRILPPVLCVMLW